MRHAEITTDDAARTLHVKKIRKAWGDTLEALFETGRVLGQAKDSLPTRQYEKMFELREVPFKKLTAWRLIVISRDKRITNPVYAQKIPLSYSTLALLAKLSDEEFDEGLREGWINPNMERSEIEERLGHKVTNPNKALEQKREEVERLRSELESRAAPPPVGPSVAEQEAMRRELQQRADRTAEQLHRLRQADHPETERQRPPTSRLRSITPQVERWQPPPAVTPSSWGRLAAAPPDPAAAVPHERIPAMTDDDDDYLLPATPDPEPLPILARAQVKRLIAMQGLEEAEKLVGDWLKPSGYSADGSAYYTLESVLSGHEPLFQVREALATLRALNADLSGRIEDALQSAESVQDEP